MEFENKVVVVTGGTRGIGRGIVEAFLKEGAKVIATYSSNESSAKKMKEECLDCLENLYLKKFDVSQKLEVQEFYEWIEEKFSQIDILINNSGIKKDNLLILMPEDDFSKVLDINLGGSFLMSKYAISMMLRKKSGRIINISSIGGKLALPGQANYAASKAGQIAMSQSLAKEVAKKGITVNCVCPGFIDTELIKDMDESVIKEYRKQVPMKRFGKVEEVANAVLFFASKKADYITGATLDISGGL